MLYQFIGGPYKGKVSEEENYSDNDPPTSFDLYDDDAKFPVPIFSFSYMMIGSKIIDGRKCFLYQYAARCDNQVVRQMENVSG